MYNFGHITSNASTDRDAQSVLNLQQVQNAYAKLIFNFLGEDSHFTYYFLKIDENTVGLRAHGADKSTTQKIQNAPWQVSWTDNFTYGVIQDGIRRSCTMSESQFKTFLITNTLYREVTVSPTTGLILLNDCHSFQ